MTEAPQDQQLQEKFAQRLQARDEIATFLRNHLTVCVERKIKDFIKSIDGGGLEGLDDGSSLLFRLEVKAEGEEFENLRELARQMRG